MSMAWGFFIYNNFVKIILIDMKLKSEYINTIHYIKALDKNVKVEDNPYLFAYYKSLGLDFVFENDTNNKKRNK